jgi:hypothetical protein
MYLLARRLEAAPPALRSDFALAVLSELIQAYRREADRARAESRPTQPGGGLSRWAVAVDALVLDLKRLRDGLVADTQVQINTRDARTLHLIVDGSPVLLNGPVTGGESLLEQRVLERFCSRNDCNDILEEQWLAAPASAMPDARPLWRFSDYTGPVCASGDGLELQFRDASNLEQKRAACRRILAELNTLVRGLRTEVSSGTTVDWNRLAILPAVGAAPRRIVLNESGDHVLMSVPALAGARRLFEQVLPWLAAKVAYKRYNLVVLNADTKLGLAASARHAR